MEAAFIVRDTFIWFPEIQQLEGN